MNLEQFNSEWSEDQYADWEYAVAAHVADSDEVPSECLRSLAARLGIPKDVQSSVMFYVADILADKLFEVKA